MQNLLPFEKISRKILVRKEADTNSDLGCRPEDRKTEEIINYGIVNIDKPKGPTSHQVSEYVQKILDISKSGHSGTLDPATTGVLPIALGRATRIVQTLLTAGKEYVAIMHLHKEVDEKTLRETIEKHFIGKIQQLPPIKSSVKRQLRTRTIYYFEILEIDGKDVLFKVGSEAGTYIRKLIHDIGQKLKTGAHMAELRRTKAGPFDESTLFTLHELMDAYYFWEEKKSNASELGDERARELNASTSCKRACSSYSQAGRSRVQVELSHSTRTRSHATEKFIRKAIQPVENGAMHLPKVWVFDTTVESLCHGVDLKVPGISKLNDNIQKDDIVAIMTLKNELVGLGTAKISSNEMLGEKSIAVQTEKVFMQPGIYKI